MTPIAIGLALAPIVIPLIQDMLNKGATPDGTPLTLEQIAEGRAVVDAYHQEIQNLSED